MPPIFKQMRDFAVPQITNVTHSLPTFFFFFSRSSTTAMSLMSDDEIEALVLENAKLKAALKASDYERGKLLELVENLMCQSSPTLMNPANTQRQNSATGHQFKTVLCTI